MVVVVVVVSICYEIAKNEKKIFNVFIYTRYRFDSVDLVSWLLLFLCVLLFEVLLQICCRLILCQFVN